MNAEVNETHFMNSSYSSIPLSNLLNLENEENKSIRNSFVLSTPSQLHKISGPYKPDTNDGTHEIRFRQVSNSSTSLPDSNSTSPTNSSSTAPTTMTVSPSTSETTTKKQATVWEGIAYTDCHELCEDDSYESLFDIFDFSFFYIDYGYYTSSCVSKCKTEIKLKNKESLFIKK